MMTSWDRAAALPLLAAGLLGLAGCGASTTPMAAAPGTIAGTVLFNGQAAPGRNVTLFSSSDGGTTWTSTNQFVATDGGGNFQFNGLQAGTYMVQYLSNAGSVAANEFVYWRTAAQSITTAGVTCPAFDIAYGGQLTPPDQATVTAPITFQWSTGATAIRYEVNLYTHGSAGAPLWTSAWVTNPAVTLTQAVPTGSYDWEVVVDGGATGIGVSRRRTILFQ